MLGAQYYVGIKSYIGDVGVGVTRLALSYILAGNFSLFLFTSPDFFEKLFQKYHQSLKQIGSRSGLTFNGLIWVQSVCKGYKQMALEDKELKVISIYKV